MRTTSDGRNERSPSSCSFPAESSGVAVHTPPRPQHSVAAFAREPAALLDVDLDLDTSTRDPLTVDYQILSRLRHTRSCPAIATDAR
jgi:hypothetical protein